MTTFILLNIFSSQSCQFMPKVTYFSAKFRLVPPGAPVGFSDSEVKPDPQNQIESVIMVLLPVLD